MRRLAVLTTALGLVLASCSDDGGGSASTDGIDEDAGSMTTALSLVPDTGDNEDFVIVNDYATAAEQLDIERPEPGEADEDDVADWFVPLTVGRDEVYAGLQNNGFFGREITEVEEWQDEVGWSPIDVDIAAEVGPSDDHTGYFAFTGTFDPDAIDDAVNDEDNVWADDLETEEQGDTEYYSWGDEDERSRDFTAVRPIGLGGRMAVLGDEALLWTWQDEPMEDGLDAVAGDEDSLADNEELGQLAAAMDDAGAVGALFSANGHTFDDALIAGAFEDSLTDRELPDDLEEELEDVPALDPYEAFATGVRIGDDGPEMIIALLHDDEDAAEDNADNLETVIDEGESVSTREPWADQLDLEDTEVDGSILVATLEFDDPGRSSLWVRIAFTRDSLLYSA